MNTEDRVIDFVISICLVIIVVTMLTGCGTLKLHHTDYNEDGSISWETEVSYCRWFNQSLEGLEIINPLFSAKLAEQEADNTEVTKAVSSGIVEGIGKVVMP